MKAEATTGRRLNRQGGEQRHVGAWPALRRWLAPFFAWIVLLVFPGLAGAYQPDETLPWFQTGSAFDFRGIDNVNIFSGDTGIVIPLSPEYLLGPSTKWQLRAYNTAKFWHMSQCYSADTVAARYAWLAGDPTIGVGWTVQPGFVLRSGFTPNRLVSYFSPDGSVHKVAIPVGGAQAVTTDGSHLRITANSATSPTSYTVEFPDGTVHSFTTGTEPNETGGSSKDFTDRDYNDTAATRFKLTTVNDSFGNPLMTVCYQGTNAWEFTSIKLRTNDCASTTAPKISFTWTDKIVVPLPSVTWRVLQSVEADSTSGTKLKVDFSYTDGTFSRNSYDAGGGVSPCLPTSGAVKVPLLQSMALSDSATSTMSSFSYSFTYWGAANGTIQRQGAINTITLPSLGTITYDYKTASGGFAQTSLCDPDTCGTGPEPLVLGVLGEVQEALDKSPAVSSRTETDPLTNRSTTVNYYRKGFFVCGTPICNASNFNNGNMLRRVTVQAPGNDDAGPATYSTRYFFHVAHPDDEAQAESNGLELERRYFQDNNTSGNPIRMLVSCYANAASCDRDEYIHAVARRSSPDVQVVWYGARPTSSDGSACPGGSGDAQCTKTNNTSYNSVAGHFDGTNIISSLPGGVNRTVETNWTASSVTQTDWLLDLYDHRFTWDGGGVSPPAGTSNGQTVVRQYADFDSTNGFLKDSRTWDSVLAKAIKSCRYNGGSGIVSGDFSQTYDSASEPTASSCPAGMPSISADSDTFGKDRTWTNLLLTKSNWRSGTGTIGWNSFDVTRDTNTGLITTSRDSNSGLSTSYTYDALGRIIKIQPAGGSTIEWPTTFCYLPGVTGFTPFIIVKKTTATPTLSPVNPLGPTATSCARDDGTPSANSGTVEGYNYDGFGRLVREVRRVNHCLSGQCTTPPPPTTGTYFARRETRYDSAGHRRFLSEWRGCPDASDTDTYGAGSISNCALPASVDPVALPTPGTWFLSFDPFGRSQNFGNVNGANIAAQILIDRTDDRVSPSILFSDTKEKTTAVCVNGTWSVSTCTGGVSSIALTDKDALGRVTRVTEPDPVTGNSSTDTTSYTYKVLDKVYNVTQGSQTRTFTYSAFGFLKSEKTPENGVSGNATTNFSLYGSLGNLRTKTDGSPASTQYNYTYDPAGRLKLLTTGAASPFTNYLVNCYDGTGTCGDSSISNYGGGTYPKGRLTRRVGWNQLGFSAAPVVDDFNYSATSGRLSSQITSIGKRGTDLTKAGFGAPATQSWTYNTQGLVSTHAHPRVSGSSTTLTVNDSEYTSGLLTKVTASWQGGGSQQLVTANYHESGRLSDYTTGSPTTVTTTISADSNVPSRPSQISSSVGGFNTGTYGYDGAGNIKSMGTSDTFAYDARSRITQAKYGTPLQNFTYDRFGNILSKAGTTLCTVSCTNNRITGASYDARGNMTGYSTESLYFDLLNRQYRNINSTLGTDFTYLFDGAGERVGKFPTGGGGTRRELARIIIEARGDSPLSCTPNPFMDVTCAANPNDGKYVQEMKDIGITSGCGGGNYCPEAQTRRDQASVFFLKGKWCQLNVNNCTWTPPACTLPPNQRFADVPCPSQFADWIEELADEGITAGCGNGNFCPATPLGSWQMLAWAQKIWPTYYPLPRVTVLTLRDEMGRVATESHQSASSGDATGNVAYERDNAFLGSQLISSVIWSGANWTTPGWQFYSSDHLGSPRLTTNTSAGTVETKKYWPYGDEAATSGNAAQRLRFATMERDDETNHFYDHARSHDFKLGRFVSPDKVGGRPRNPQSWNRYTYSSNNPLNTVDRNGLWPTKIHNEIINRAFPGLTPAQRQVLMSASYWVDRHTGAQLPAQSYQHAMRARGQSIEAAGEKAANFYKQNVAEASKLQSAAEQKGLSELSSAALFSLGKALHPVSDATSPQHEGFQLWRGTSPLDLPAAGAHVVGESSISPERMEMAVEMVRAAFAEAFGMDALNKAAPPPPRDPCQQNLQNCSGRGPN